MAAHNRWSKFNANKILLEATENVFSDKAHVVKNLLKSNRELFSQEVLDRSLLSCCRNGTIIMMPAIITSGANLEVTEENGNTPLFVCALNSHESCARYLINAGANVNTVNHDGNTPLIVSVFNSASIGITKLLVGRKDVRIDHVNNNGYTALMCAIEATNLNAIKLLIDVDSSSDKNNTDPCLNLEVIASRKGLLNVLKLLKLQKITGKSPFLHAALNRDLDSSQILTCMDASILNKANDSFAIILIQFLKSIQENNIFNPPEVEMFEFLLTHVAANSLSSSDKETIMDIAIFIGDYTIVEHLTKFDFVISNQNLSSVVSKPHFLRLLLIQRHIINKLDSNNQPVYDGSPLDNAMRLEEIESAKALIEHGAYMDIDLALETAVKNNKEKALQFIQTELPVEFGHKLKSPQLLHYAITNSALNIISYLLDCGADINAELNGKHSLTHVVNVNVLDLLLSRGADPNVKIGSENHTYPLHEFVSSDFMYALRKRWGSLQTSGVSDSFLNSEIEGLVKCLLNYGAKVYLKSGYGRTALHLAAQRSNSVGILNLLINAGAPLNIMDDDGETPLWKAVFYERVDNVECLIKAGVDIDFVCKCTDESVIFIATNEDILKLLLDTYPNVLITPWENPLSSLLKIVQIGTENVKRLIDAGCDVHEKDYDGYTALIIAARYVNIELLTLLVQEGADVNASTGKPRFITAVTAMLIKLWNHAESATSCINYLIDQNAKIDNIHSSVIHVFITSGCLSLIPRFISRGLAPTYLSMEKSAYAWYTSKTCISPLVMALLLDQSDLARYFLNIKYLMKSDISILSGQRDVQIHLKIESTSNSLEFCKSVSQQPLSLETLCLVVLSDKLGSTEDRRAKVEQLGLSQPLQDLLLFKNVAENDIDDTGTKNLFLFKHSLKQLSLFKSDSYDEDEDDSDFNSDEED